MSTETNFKSGGQTLSVGTEVGIVGEITEIMECGGQNYYLIRIVSDLGKRNGTCVALLPEHIFSLENSTKTADK